MILAGLENQVRVGGYASADDKVTKLTGLHAALDSLFGTVSGVASRVTQALASKKPAVRNQEVAVDTKALRDASAPEADRFVALEKKQRISKNVEQQLYRLKQAITNVRTNYSVQIEDAKAQRTILAQLTKYNQDHP